jgi:hypothetical protein
MRRSNKEVKTMNKIKQILIKIDNWLSNLGYSMYPELTKHMKK